MPVTHPLWPCVAGSTSRLNPATTSQAVSSRASVNNAKGAGAGLSAVPAFRGFAGSVASCGPLRPVLRCPATVGPATAQPDQPVLQAIQRRLGNLAIVGQVADLVWIGANIVEFLEAGVGLRRRWRGPGSAPSHELLP